MAHRAHPVQTEAAEPPRPWRDFWLPLALIAIGVVVWVGQALFAPADAQRSALAAVVLVVVSMAVNVMLMLAGAFLAAQLLGVTFGPVGAALLKMAGTVIFAGAVGAVVWALGQHQVVGMVIAWHAVVIIYWLLFWLFFGLDPQEALLSVALAALLQAGGMCILWRT